MFAIVVGCGLSLSAPSPQAVKLGMPFAVVQALMREKPAILSLRGNNSIRAVQYRRTRLIVDLDEEGRVLLVNGKGEKEATAETELERIAQALPDGFKRSGCRPLLKSGEKPDKDSETFGYCRLRVARMTSDTTAKVTVSFYFKGKDGEEECGTLFIHLSWYRGWWTITKYEGDTERMIFRDRLTAYVDEISGNRPKR